MKIDLRKDKKTISSFIKKRISAFSPQSDPCIGNGSNVHQINFGYSVDQAGFFALVFDTREDANTDGEWNNALEDDNSFIDMLHWSDAYDRLVDMPIIVIDHQGQPRECSESAESCDFNQLVGEMLLALLMDAKQQGWFKTLPVASTCHIAIEDQLGGWGWPEYDDRGQAETTL
jgi:hypothetical protein